MRRRRHLLCLAAALATAAAALIVSQPRPVAAATGGSITIVLAAAPADGTDFGFTGCAGSGCGSFALDKDSDPTLPNTVTATELATGTYTVTQDAVPGWTLTGLSCTSGGSANVANRRATVTITAGSAVTCTFTDQSPSITIVQDTSPDGPADLTYTGCQGAGCGTFSLDDDADPTLPNTVTAGALAPGTYTITQGPSAVWSLTGLSCSTTTGVTKDAAQRQVTIVLSAPTDHRTCTFTNKTQGITIVEDDLADAGDDYAFTSCQQGTGCGAFTLDDDAGADDAHADRVVSGPLPIGTYTITQDALAGHELANLVCGGEQADLVARRGTITLTAGETRTCTFSNRATPAPLTGVAEVVVGQNHACARLDDGQARCWGDRVLGDGAVDTSAAPKVVLNPAGDGPLTGVVDIAAGAHHTCAALEDGTAVCWGTNLEGELGNGSTNTTGSDVLPFVVQNPEATGPLTDVASIEAGFYRSCAVLTDGQARCWGSNATGALGNATTTDAVRPVVVLDGSGTSPLTDVAQIVTGVGHTCALLTSGQVRCWGDGTTRQLGDGNATDSLTPVAVSNPEGTGPLTGVTQLSSWWGHTCARALDGSAACWGNVPAGSNRNVVAARPTPVLDRTGAAPATGITNIDAGYDHTCFRTDEGSAQCWGEDPNGELGNGALGQPSSLPVDVIDRVTQSPLTHVAGIAAGYSTSCATLATGEARCWGAYAGDGVASYRPWAVAVVAP